MALRLDVTYPDGERVSFALTADEIIVGRDPGLGLSLPDAKVSRRHARIIRRDDAYWLQDLGSANGLLLDGLPLSGQALITPGSVVELGDCRIDVVEGDAEQAPLPADGPRYVSPLGAQQRGGTRFALKVVEGELLGQSFVLDLEETIVGRGLDADLTLDAASISRRHAIIRAGDDHSVIIEDLGSSNGTYVGELPIGGAQTLRLGDHVRFGTLLLQLVPQAAVPPPQPGDDSPQKAATEEVHLNPPAPRPATTVPLPSMTQAPALRDTQYGPHDEKEAQGRATLADAPPTPDTGARSVDPIDTLDEAPTRDEAPDAGPAPEAADPFEAQESPPTKLPPHDLEPSVPTWSPTKTDSPLTAEATDAQLRPAPPADRDRDVRQTKPTSWDEAPQPQTVEGAYDAAPPVGEVSRFPEPSRRTDTPARPRPSAASAATRAEVRIGHVPPPSEPPPAPPTLGPTLPPAAPKPIGPSSTQVAMGAVRRLSAPIATRLRSKRTQRLAMAAIVVAGVGLATRAVRRRAQTTQLPNLSQLWRDGADMVLGYGPQRDERAWRTRRSKELATATTALADGDWDNAQAALSRALKLDATHPEALQLRGRLERAMRAEGSATQALALRGASRWSQALMAASDALNDLEGDKRAAASTRRGELDRIVAEARQHLAGYCSEEARVACGQERYENCVSQAACALGYRSSDHQALACLNLAASITDPQNAARPNAGQGKDDGVDVGSAPAVDAKAAATLYPDAKIRLAVLTYAAGSTPLASLHLRNIDNGPSRAVLADLQALEKEQQEALRCEQAGNFGQALTAYEHALVIDARLVPHDVPSGPRALLTGGAQRMYLTLGDAAFAKNNYGEAMAQWQRGLSLSPDFLPLLQALDKLSSKAAALIDQAALALRGKPGHEICPMLQQALDMTPGDAALHAKAEEMLATCKRRVKGRQGK